MPPSTHYKRVKRVTLVSVAVNSMLAIIKIVFGLLGQSHALIADGVHSVSDLLTDALVLVASKFGSRTADIDHPYGHERIETAGTLGLALLLALAGGGIIYDSIEHLFTRTHLLPHTYVLWIALISILTNEALCQYTLRVAKALGSNLLRSNAWHHRSDAASSLVVLIGIGSTLLGIHYADTLAAIIVGLMIIKMGVGLAWSSVRELVDTGVDLDTLKKVEHIIRETPGVLDLHQLRTRSMGGRILVDVHVLVDAHISVSEGHHIATTVHGRLETQITSITDVTVHIDPEDDEAAIETKRLPHRDNLLPQLTDCWQTLPGANKIKIMQTHYLNAKIELLLHLPLKTLEKSGDSAETLTKKYQAACATLPIIHEIQLVFS